VFDLLRFLFALPGVHPGIWESPIAASRCSYGALATFGKYGADLECVDAYARAVMVGVQLSREAWAGSFGVEVAAANEAAKRLSAIWTGGKAETNIQDAELVSLWTMLPIYSMIP